MLFGAIVVLLTSLDELIRVLISGCKLEGTETYQMVIIVSSEKGAR